VESGLYCCIIVQFVNVDQFVLILFVVVKYVFVYLTCVSWKKTFKVLSFVCHAQLHFTVELQIIDISKGWRIFKLDSYFLFKLIGYFWYFTPIVHSMLKLRIHFRLVTISLIMSLMVSKQRKKKYKSIKMIFWNPFLYTWDTWKKTFKVLSLVCHALCHH
jgi:hypothetical protein